MKKLAYILLLTPLLSWGQKPFINSISPRHVEVGQMVTISGSNLGGRVFFGGVEATSVTGSGNLIEAEVPAGVTHGSITVLNNTLVAHSSQQFYISFSGSDLTNYDAENATSSGETDANDICLCDLDGDDLNDAVISHSVSESAKSEISIYRNQSTPVATLFTKLTNVNNSENISGFIANTCADLDNDGQPELIFTTNQGTNAKHIYIYRNQSTAGSINMTYLSSLSLRLPNSGGNNRIPRKIRARDMDGDGKNDLVVGNDTDNTFHIFTNTSSGTGNFSFASPEEFGSGDDRSGNLEVLDLNNDGRLDVISGPFRDQAQQATSSVYLIKNNSIEGSLSFNVEGSVSNGTDRIGTIIGGDFDQDGLNDIAVSSRDAGTINVYRNTTSGSISFASDANLTGLGTPFGLGLGDMDGDGNLDLVSSRAAGDVLVFENTSTSGNIAFASAVVVTTSNTSQNICAGDLNGDAKPDIAFTLDISTGAIGKLGVFMNRNCMEPTLSPSSAESSFCDTPDTFTLTATASPGATYDWTVVSANNIGAGGNNFNTGTTNSASLEIAAAATSATIRVTTTSQDGMCTTEMDEQTYMITNGVTATPTIQISPTGVLCVGDNATLSTTATFDTYLWTLPDGSTQTSATVSLSPAQAADAGTYSVVVQNSGNCTSDADTQVVQVSTPPTFDVFNNGNDTFCSDGANDPVLEVSNIAGITYQWKRGGSDISGATSASFAADQTGAYTVEITDSNGCSTETTAYTVTEISQPVSSMSGPTETCVNFETTFSATSTVQTGFTPIHNWVVEDNTDTQVGSFTGTDFPFTFATVADGPYEVILTTSYDPTDVASCAASVSQMITVSPEPTIVFNNPADTIKCQLDSLELSLSSPPNITSYQWIQNGDTTTGTTVFAKTTGTNTFVDVRVIVTTDIGCEVENTITVRNFDTDVDISSQIFDLSGDTVTLEDDNFIVLTAENVVSDITWSPESIVNDPTAITVTVFPATSPTTVTLTGVDSNGCTVASEVMISLNNIRPRRTFSPNGDGLGFDCWEILNTSDLQDCKVYVFDSRGRNILVKNSPFENNCVWDGNFNGTEVPEGLYYFVLKCGMSELSQSGSILLAR